MTHVKSLLLLLAGDFFLINSDLEALGESIVLDLDFIYFRMIFLSVVPEVVITTGLAL